MRQIVVQPHLTREEIARQRDTAQSKRHYRWWQIIWLALQGTYQAEAIGEMVGMKTQSIYNLLSRYNHKGPEGLTPKPWGGCQRRLISPVQEQELLQSLHEQASRGEITTASQIRQAVERAVGHRVSQSAIYTLLRRAEWRKVVPRPRHPEQDLQAQEDFKKNIQS
jgi:transposase